MTIQKLFLFIGVISLLLSWYRNHYKKSGEGLILNTIQAFLALLFIFSGLVKAIDPKGTSYKMHEYFESFAKDGFPGFWEFLSEFSLAIALIMIVLEIVLGVMIFIGRKPRIASLGMLGINLFFLYLTGYSYLSGYCLSPQTLVVSALILALMFLSGFIQNPAKRFQGLSLTIILLCLYFIYCKMSGHCANCSFTETKMKVTDCGCFGDFMKLKTWETFYKDIFLTAISAILVRHHHQLRSMFSDKSARNLVLSSFVLSLLFCVYNTNWAEPVIDFRPYKIGNNINEQMKEILPSKIENILVYKNNSTGNIERFAINNIPTDTNWTFVDRIDSVIQEGIPAPIKALRLEDASGNDVTPSLLNEAATSYWVVCYNIYKSNRKAIDEVVIPFAAEMRKKGVNVYCLLGKSSGEFEKKIGATMDIVHADETALKTMVRSNPGIMKIRNGAVLNKWHWRQFNGDK